MATTQVPKCPHCRRALSVNSFIGDLPQCPPSIPLDLLNSDQLLHDTFPQSNTEAMEQRLASLNGLFSFATELRDSVLKAASLAKLQLAQVKEGRNFSHGLPVELLRTVFLLVPAPRNVKFDWKEDRSVIRLASVCRTWRRVALECPELWAEFLVTSNSRDERIQLFLSRSQDRPLTLTWYSRELLSEANDPGWKINKLLLAAILPHSPRWRHVHFEDLPSGLIRIVYPLQSVTSLQSLAITSIHDFPPNFVSEAVHLNSLRLMGEFIERLEPTSFPWIQIQFLRLDFVELDLRPVMSILPHLSNIIDLNISSGYIVDEIISYGSITLPLLRTLSLNGNWFLLLTKLVTPNIRKLGLPSYNHSSSSCPELGKFISENRSLRDVCVAWRGYNFRLPEPCSLRRLAIQFQSTNQDNLQLLSCSYLQQYFPFLEALEVMVFYEENWLTESEDEVEDVETVTVITIVEGLFHLCQERDRISNDIVPSEFLKRVVINLLEVELTDRALDVWVNIRNRCEELQNVELEMTWHHEPKT
ncbi:hypothetical protein DL96DRAFT_1816387 [Flagelloscypha sp. PMI_526]|nr:hypothetical protein DL96DRAFT_1816387 [Flagelloscypha sp. PMI_526]